MHQCTRGTLKRPLREIIKSIGHDHCRILSSARRDVHCTSSSDRLRRPASARFDRCSPCSDHLASTNSVSSCRYATAAAPRQTGDTAAVPNGGQSSAAAATSSPSLVTKKQTVTRTRTDAVEDGAPEPRFRDGRDFSTLYYRKQRYKHLLEEKKTIRRSARRSPREPATWKRILKLLEETTPSSADQHKRITELVTLPAGSTAVFKPSKETAILEIMQRTGCHLQMAITYAVEGNPDAFTGLALQGTVVQNSSALALLPRYVEVSSLHYVRTRGPLRMSALKRQNETRGLNSFTHRSQRSEPVKVLEEIYADSRLIRSTWTVDRMMKDLQPRQSRRALPALKSPLDFTAYISDLISKRTEYLPVRQDTNSEATEDDLQVRGRSDFVTKQLVTAFSDAATLPLVTVDAIGRAFEYLAKHARIDAVRQIFRTLVEAGCDIGAPGYNALLAAAANVSDSHNFELVLRIMRRRGQSPDAMTWALFHNLVFRNWPGEVDTITTLMRKKSLLQDNAALETVVKQKIERDLTVHLRDRGTLPDFVEMQGARISREFNRTKFNWLTADTLNRMLKVLITLGRTKDSVALLEHFRKRGRGTPTTATLNIFLSSTSHDFDAASAIATLKLFQIGEPGALIPDSYTYQILFMVAWRRKYYNMLRVVWRYACVAGAVTYDMRHRTLKSLLAYSSRTAEEVNRSSMFKAFAGKFAVGVLRDLIPGPHIPYDVSPTRPLGSDEKRVLELGAQQRFEKSTSNSIARRRELKSLQTQDIAEATHCKPLLPLSLVLERAWHKDVRWQERGLGQPDADSVRDLGRAMFEEALLHGIRVPMRPGDFTVYRKWEIPWLLRRDAQLEAQRVDTEEVRTMEP